MRSRATKIHVLLSARWRADHFTSQLAAQARPPAWLARRARHAPRLRDSGLFCGAGNGATNNRYFNGVTGKRGDCGDDGTHQRHGNGAAERRGGFGDARFFSAP